MAAKKPTAQAAAKQPAASKPADKPEDQTTAPSTGEESVKAPEAPETKPGETGGEQSTERGPATDGNLPPSSDNEPGSSDNEQQVDELAESDDTITLEVVTTLDRRIRAGVTVTKDPRTVEVTQEVAERLAADPHISVKAK